MGFGRRELGLLTAAILAGAGLVSTGIIDGGIGSAASVGAERLDGAEALPTPDIRRAAGYCNNGSRAADAPAWKTDLVYCETARDRIFQYVKGQTEASYTEQMMAFYRMCGNLSMAGLCRAKAARQIGRSASIETIEAQCSRIPDRRFRWNCYKGYGQKLNDPGHLADDGAAMDQCDRLERRPRIFCKKGVAYTMRQPLDVHEEAEHGHRHEHTGEASHTEVQAFKEEYGSRYLDASTEVVSTLIDTCDSFDSVDRVYCYNTIGYQVGWHNAKLEKFELQRGKRYNWTRVKRLCHTLSDQYRIACVNGVGRMISRLNDRGYALQDGTPIDARMCSAFSGVERDVCLRGSFRLETFEDGWTPETMAERCAAQDAAYRRYCHQVAGYKFLAVSGFDAATAKDRCDAMGSGASTCRDAVEASMRALEDGSVRDFTITTHFCGM